MLAQLEEREAKLAYAIQVNSIELARVRTTLAGLRQLRQPIKDGKPVLGTRDVIRFYLTTINSGDRVCAENLLEFAQTECVWKRVPVDPIGAFRCALARLWEHDATEIKRTTFGPKNGSGEYTKP